MHAVVGLVRCGSPTVFIVVQVLMTRAEGCRQKQYLALSRTRTRLDVATVPPPRISIELEADVSSALEGQVIRSTPAASMRVQTIID